MLGLARAVPGPKPQGLALPSFRRSSRRGAAPSAGAAAQPTGRPTSHRNERGSVRVPASRADRAAARGQSWAGYQSGARRRPAGSRTGGLPRAWPKLSSQRSATVRQALAQMPLADAAGRQAHDLAAGGRWGRTDNGVAIRSRKPMDAPTASQVLQFVVELDRKGRDQPRKRAESPPPSLLVVTG